MSDKDWLWTSGMAVALLILWWLARRSSAGPTVATNPNEAAFPVAWDEPMTGPFDANPRFNSPPGNRDISITVKSPFVGTLASNFMPLFGFVGIAQGAQFE